MTYLLFFVLKEGHTKMRELLHLLENPYEKDFNLDFIKSKNDYKISDLVVMCMKDTEIISNITIESYGINENYEDIDINQHKVNINFKRKNPYDVKIPKYKYIYDSYYSLMWFNIRIETNLNSKIITKYILIPKETDEGYYIINNKKAKAIWQMVEASVYTQRGKTTLKSRMPIIIYKTVTKEFKDSEGNIYSFKPYSYAMDTTKKKANAKVKTSTKTKNKFINPWLIFAAKLGLRGAIKFMAMDKIITIVQYDDISLHDEYTYVPMNNLFIRVNKKYLDNDLITSLVGMLSQVTTTEFPVTWELLDDVIYWVSRIGIVGTKHDKPLSEFYNKGITTIMMIERLLDDMTIRNLRLPDSHKSNIYEVLRWMIMQYDELKVKENIDLTNKRVRKNEYIVKATLGRKINDNINRVITHRSDSRSNTIDTLLEIFNFGDDIILNGMKNINDLIKIDDITNDLTIIEDLAYSSKGPEALGDGSSKNVMVKMRDVHPSMIGRVDCECTYNSDVGMSGGSFVPYVKIYDNFYFTPEREPDSKMFDINSLNYKTLADPDPNASKIINFSTGEVSDLPELDTSSLEAFNDSLKVRDDAFGIEYEKITIVEHESNK